jgi:hypothetical protein
MATLLRRRFARRDHSDVDVAGGPCPTPNLAPDRSIGLGSGILPFVNTRAENGFRQERTSMASHTNRSKLRNRGASTKAARVNRVALNLDHQEAPAKQLEGDITGLDLPLPQTIRWGSSR